MALDGKTIVVTGSASGIGAETSELLRKQGARIIGLDITRETGNVDEFIHLDLLDDSSINTAAANLPGAIDALCNIAGLPPGAGRARVIKVNFLGLRRFSELAAEKMVEGSAIINMASGAGFGWIDDIERVKKGLALGQETSLDELEAFCREQDISDVFSYLYSKELLIAWTKVTASIWRMKGIRVNSVSPGPVETPILQDFMDAFGNRAKLDLEEIGRAGTTGDIAPVVSFLCSEAAAWITGANIAVDGGLEAERWRQKLGI
ncbi:MAG: coniferyl-alcohol dehydrogenase [Proteobacteria bacterium]|nr:coniferyl-alcohol dehydrogenase [Pseudomonadota bacterium]